MIEAWWDMRFSWINAHNMDIYAFWVNIFHFPCIICLGTVMSLLQFHPSYSYLLMSYIFSLSGFDWSSWKPYASSNHYRWNKHKTWSHGCKHHSPTWNSVSCNCSWSYNWKFDHESFTGDACWRHTGDLFLPHCIFL